MPKRQYITEKLNKLGFIKLRNFCSAKNTVKRFKRQAIYWEKIFAAYIFDTGLVSRLYKELLKLKNSQNSTNSKMVKRLGQILHQRAYKDGK